MKVVKVIKNIVVGFLLIAFFGFAITITITLLNLNKYGVTQFNDTSLIVIKEEISSDKYQKGDLVTVNQKKIDKIKPGDEIFIYKVKKDGGVSIDVGIIGEVHKENDAISFENGSTYDMKYAAGEANKIYSNNIGNYYSLFQSKWGFLFIILVPSFLIFVYEIYALVVEVKYGKDEE